MKKFIKISKTQWIASGIKKGHIIPKNDGSFTLSKQAQWGAIAGLVGRQLGIGTGVGVLASLLGSTNVLQSAQDWWAGGSETPAMLKNLQDFKGRFDQEVKGRLSGISVRLDADMERISAKIEERIATFTERLNQRGIGPIQEEGQRLLDGDILMNEMTIAATTPPSNPELVWNLIKTPSSASSPNSGVTPPASTTPTTSSTTPSSAVSNTSGGGGNALQKQVTTSKTSA